METKTLLAALIITFSGPLCADPLSDAERAFALESLTQLKADHAPSLHALCAAWNTLADEPTEAERHRALAAKDVGYELANDGIVAVMEHAQGSLDAGDMPREDLITGADLCRQL